MANPTPVTLFGVSTTYDYETSTFGAIGISAIAANGSDIFRALLEKVKAQYDVIAPPLTRMAMSKTTANITGGIRDTYTIRFDRASTPESVLDEPV